MSKHTPGPWIWGENRNGLYGAGPNNEVLAYAPCENMWLGGHEKAEHNAALIAEAPALLEALRAFVGAAYPVANVINSRGHNWSEAYLDRALADAQELLERLES